MTFRAFKTAKNPICRKPSGSTQEPPNSLLSHSPSHSDPFSAWIPKIFVPVKTYPLALCRRKGAACCPNSPPLTPRVVVLEFCGNLQAQQKSKHLRHEGCHCSRAHLAPIDHLGPHPQGTCSQCRKLRMCSIERRKRRKYPIPCAPSNPNPKISQDCS